MGEDASSADIIFNISPKNVALREFKVILWSLFETSLENCNVDKNSVVTLSQGLSANSVDAQINVVDTNGELVVARVIFDNPKSSRPAVTYQFKPLQTDLSIHFRVSIDVPYSEDNNGVFNFYDSYNLLKDLNIDYVMLNINRDNEWDRFSKDNTHFTVELSNAAVIIFKVNK
jgi:hypothetical protein